MINNSNTTFLTETENFFNIISMLLFFTHFKNKINICRKQLRQNIERNESKDVFVFDLSLLFCAETK